MQAALKGEQNSFLPLGRKPVDNARAASAAIRHSVEIAGCVERQGASWELSYAAAVEIEEGRFFSGAINLEDSSREGSCSKQVAVAVEND